LSTRRPAGRKYAFFLFQRSHWNHDHDNHTHGILTPERIPRYSKTLKAWEFKGWSVETEEP
jgi:hypothetical protein